MRKPTSIQLLVALVGALALLLGGCAQDDADDEPADTTDTTDQDDEDGEDDEQAESDGLVLGSLLPETGDLAFLGEGMIAATELAVEDMNDADGVLGEDVELITADEGDEAATVQEGADRLIGNDVDGIIGAAASGQSLEVIDTITGAGVAQCSGSNTSPTFTDLGEDLYFRTAPSDALQGPVLADLVVEQGHTDVAILARADDYGQGLADATEQALEGVGASVVAKEIYDPDTGTFDAEVSTVEEAGADAVVLVSFEEGVSIMQNMIESGLGPDEVGIFGADGLRSEGLPEEVEPGNPNALDGMMGTAPNPGADEDFLDRLREHAGGELEETIFAAQKYDCAVLMGLGAIAADSTEGGDIAEQAVELTNGETECSSFEECKGLLEDGESIAYRGPSGLTALTDVGDPESGEYEIWQFEDGELTSVEVREATVSGAGGE